MTRSPPSPDAEPSSERVIESLRRENAALAAEIARVHRDTQEFISMLAHDLRTPLGAILMWSHVLRTGRDSDRQPALDAIEGSAHEQSILIGRVLDLTRALSGRLRLVFKACDVTEVVREAVARVSPLAEAAGVRIENTGDLTGILGLTADPSRITDMLVSLLRAAIRRSPSPDSVRISVDDSPGEVTFVVHDRARALSVDESLHLFDPFRLPGELVPGAVAIELALTRALANLHHGTVRAEGDPSGQGNRFVLAIPKQEIGDRRT